MKHNFKFFPAGALLCLAIGLSGMALVKPQAETLFRGEQGSVFFRSDAPLELIEAKSDELKAILNPENGNFAFTVPIKSFQGFNSPLQKVHFNENYMESGLFPNASFQGKVIEQIDYSADGDYIVRAKGQLNIHGQSQERIIKGNLKITGNKLEISSQFTVPLKDHDIKIPKIVFQKIAEEIYLEIKMSLSR